ncbi:MAG: hypothetical protein ABIC68_07115 [Candidatus Omnitrophota bacterium]
MKKAAMIDFSFVNQKTESILNKLLIVFFFSLLSIYCSREICDLDIWLHLKTGELIIKNRAIPLFDIYSFTLGQKAWINHEWLFQVIAYKFYAANGADGLIFMQNLIVFCTFLTLFFIGFNKKNHVFVFVVLYLTLLTCAYRFTIRPDIFSLLFLALYLAILKNFLEKKENYGNKHSAFSKGFDAIWLLPLLQTAWTNMHGFSFTGPLIVLIYLLGELIKRTPILPVAWQHTRRLNDSELKKLFIVLALTIVVSIINPHGITGALYPFSVLGQISSEGKVIFNYIQELARPITLKSLLNTNFFFFYKVYILISLFSFRINRKHLDISDFILWLAFLFFSIIAVRNVAYFAIVAAYCIFSNIHLAFENKSNPLLHKLPKKIKILGYYASIAILFYFPAKGASQYLESANYNFHTYELKSAMWGISELRFPQKAVDFLLEHDFPKNILNDFNSGSYLIGRCAPKRQVFIDGRTELYGPVFFKNYVALCEGKKDVLEKTLAEYNIQGVFLTNGDNRLHAALLTYFFKNPEWVAVYFDENATIFLKRTKENSILIKEYQIDLKNRKAKDPDFLELGIAFRYPWPYVERARILNILNCHEAAAQEAAIALRIMPNNAKALGYMSDYYFEQDDYKKAYEYTRNALVYNPKDLILRTKLALIYHKLKDDDKAFKVINAINKNSPEFAYGYFIKARIVAKSDKQQAIQLLHKATELAPKVSEYHMLLANLLEEEGEISEAQTEYLKALEFDSAEKKITNKLKNLSKK